MGELCSRSFAAGFPFLGQALDAEDLGGREGTRPFGEEDVVFEVWGGEVGDIVAEGFNGGTDFGC